MHFLVKADIQNWVTYSQNSAFLQTNFFFYVYWFYFYFTIPRIYNSITIHLFYCECIFYFHIHKQPREIYGYWSRVICYETNFLMIKVSLGISFFHYLHLRLYSEYHEVQKNINDKNYDKIYFHTTFTPMNNPQLVSFWYWVVVGEITIFYIYICIKEKSWYFSVFSKHL